MRVTLFRDMLEENWPSMETYADGLVAGFAKTGLGPLALQQFTTRCPRLPLGRAASIYFGRAVCYPVQARRAQGELNHVIDHSYAHLLHFLDARRTVVTCNDLVPLVLRHTLPRRSLGLWLWDWAFRGMLKAGRIIAISENTRRDILRSSGYDASRVAVVYDGVEDGFRPVDAEAALREARERFGLDSAPMVLHVGHCAQRKNLEGLLRALHLVAQRGHDFHFCQVGGTFDGQQRELVASLGLSQRVRQFHRVSREDLVALYNLATVFAFPSFYEGFGLPVLEAMACGTPVVCSNASSLPEVAGDAALMIPPEDDHGLAEGIARLLEDEGLRRELAAKGLARARAFTWERCARQTFKVYQELYQEVYG